MKTNWHAHRMGEEIELQLAERKLQLQPLKKGISIGLKPFFSRRPWNLRAHSLAWHDKLYNCYEGYYKGEGPIHLRSLEHSLLCRSSLTYNIGKIKDADEEIKVLQVHPLDVQGHISWNYTRWIGERTWLDLDSSNESPPFV